MYKIQTLNKISPIGLDQFSHDNYEYASEIINPDAILVRSQDMHQLELPESLLAVARCGAGVNNIPVDKCSKKGIIVFNTPGANANAVKELVITGLFLSSRLVYQGINWVKSLSGKEDVPALVEKEKAKFTGPEIKGKKLGVIGLGAIGVMVANDAESLGMEVSGYDPFLSVDAAWGLSRNVKKALTIDSLISESDYITIHIPLNDKTKNLINKDKFAIMKKGVRILNFARAALINNNDLKDAIKSGIVSSYITDFPESDLIKLEQVITIPHLGASTPESEDNCAVMAANQLKDYLELGNIVNSVNYPDCSLPLSGKKRILISNRNIPNMIGQITPVLADNKINIAEMLNKSKGEYAYNIIDIDGNIDSSVIEKLKSIEGIIRVRVIEQN